MRVCVGVRAKHLQVSSSNRERQSERERGRRRDNDSKKSPSTSTFLHEIKSHGSDAYKVGTKTKQSDAGPGRGAGGTGERRGKQPFNRGAGGRKSQQNSAKTEKEKKETIPEANRTERWRRRAGRKAEGKRHNRAR